MSRVAKNPVIQPIGVSVDLDGQQVLVKGSRGFLSLTVHESVKVSKKSNTITFDTHDSTRKSRILAGTTRALVNNMIIGVHQGYNKQLILQGVGYRVSVIKNTLQLSLGFSHVVDYELPEGITAECVSQNEIILRGIDRQLVGQVAAEVRGFRPPELYKGKGIRYVEENIRCKEAKKK